MPRDFLRPPGFSINTADFRAEERFGAFLMTPITNTGAMTFECADPNVFDCEMEFQLFGGASLVDIKRLSRVTCRISEEIARLGMFSLQICHSGRISGAHQGPLLHAERGEALFLNMNVVTTMGYSDGSRAHGLYVDPSRLRPLLKSSLPDSPTVISAADPGLKLLSAWLLALSQAEVSHDDGVRPTVDQHIIDLVALALGARDDASEEAEARTGRSARLQAILGLIAARCTEPLTARDAAMQLGISERYVRQLLEETGYTFTEHVQERRLLTAFRMLGDPRCAEKRIADIAHACGFSDATYFNRVFRRRFEKTPSDLRRSE